MADNTRQTFQALFTIYGRPVLEDFDARSQAEAGFLAQDRVTHLNITKPAGTVAVKTTTLSPVPKGH